MIIVQKWSDVNHLYLFHESGFYWYNRAMTLHNKLVRDKIPEYLDSKEIPYRLHIADKEEYWMKLKEKLAEEVIEFQKDESIDELADLLEVIDAVKKYKNISDAEIAEVKSKKFADRGGFDKRIILEES